MLLRRASLRLVPALLLAAGLIGTWGSSALGAAPIFNEVHTIAAPTTGVPQEFTFSISNPGTYTVTLTDLGALLTPSAPLGSVKMAVTSGDALVGTTLVGAGTLTLSSLTAGSYTLHVIGAPGSQPGSGPFGIEVENASKTQVASFQGTLALPSPALPNGEGVLDDSFSDVPSTGSYTVTLSDLQLPQALNTLTLLLIAQGSAVPVVTLPTNTHSYQATVTLNPGVTYRIFAVGAPGATVTAGLFSAVVSAGSSPGGTVIYGKAVPAGATTSVGTPALTAGSATLHLTDLKYPTALSQLGAVVTLNGVPAAQLAGAGSQAFTASATTYQVFAAGTAAAPAGSYAVEITGVTPTFSVAQGVTPAGSALSAYGFNTTISTAGAYTVTLGDFQFPAALSSVSLAAVQNAALLGTPISSAGALDINTAAGPLSLLVFAQPGAAAGLFGIDVAAGQAAPVFEVTQAVGALFIVRQLPITAAGSYSVTATDLGFPANFMNYDTIVTQGTTQVGSIYGGGTFKFTASTGTYYLNFIAQTTGSDEAGTYALTVASTPPAPTVSLTTDQSQVSSGSTVNLIWSSQNATSCTASGGWSGTEAVSGTMTSAPLSESTTFTLSCTGAGGSTSKSVTVTVTSASHGGGGAVDVGLAALLGVLLLLRALRRPPPSMR